MILEKDELGVPSTIGAIFLNVLNISNVEVVSHVFTWIISCLSIVYLVYKIKNEKTSYDRRQNDRKESDTAPKD
jgi:hypothetical protein